MIRKKVVEVPTVIEPEVKKISKLTVTFQNEDSNKLVEKINELIDKANDSI